jgi:predicted nucleic acid-binding protein
MNLIDGEKYIFDTSVFIDYLRGRTVAKNLHHQVRFRNVSVGYSVITTVELWDGITGMWTEEQHIILLKLYRCYFMNKTIARRAGTFHKDLKTIVKKVPALPDCIIAATAHYYDLTLVSANSRDMIHFTQFGVKVQIYQQ